MSGIGGVVPVGAAVRNNLLAVVGDSFSSQSYFDGTDFIYNNADGFVPWACALSGQRMTVVSWAARGNSRVSADAGSPGVRFDIQVQQAIASGADNLLIMGGVNDCFAGFPLAQITGAYDACLQAAIGAGMRVWACTQPTMNSSFGSYTVAIQAKLLALNEWLRQRVASTYAKYGVTVVDIAAAAVDASSATANWRTSGSQDNLHPRNVGAYYMGKELARVWSLFAQEVPQLPSSNADNYGYSTACTNYLDNGLFVNGAGTATGFTGSVIVGGLSTNSLVARSDGFGNSQRMVQTSAANNDGYRLASSNYASRFSAGDTVYAQCLVDVSAITALRGVQMQLVASGTTTRAAYDLFVDTTNDAALPEGFTVVLRTPPIQIVGTPVTVVARVDSNYSGAGGATIDVSRMAIRKVASA